MPDERPIFMPVYDSVTKLSAPVFGFGAGFLQSFLIVSPVGIDCLFLVYFAGDSR
ncbi:hypothetical protein BDV40DRAFT_250936 [Aspergillus tamarii]|uniref:Uncharacterized protein n=1 Tax=Aspergillus tamarii TaxID=41984 RepID=A0A5N6VBP6_ASPTM|nr:hypothetical protein BDV40DRAFT_250936 [Aspergillus tamarii]